MYQSLTSKVLAITSCAKGFVELRPTAAALKVWFVLADSDSLASRAAQWALNGSKDSMGESSSSLLAVLVIPFPSSRFAVFPFPMLLLD